MSAGCLLALACGQATTRSGARPDAAPPFAPDGSVRPDARNDEDGRRQDARIGDRDGSAGADARPATPPPRGAFRIEGTRILDPQGNEFVPLGANVVGWNYYDWPNRSAGFVQTVSEAWRFNVVRANVGLKPQVWKDNVVSPKSWRTDRDEADRTLDALIDGFTKRQIVVVIEAHDWTCGYPRGDDVTLLEEFWTHYAARYRDNPYVWFNVLNEPEWDDSASVSPEWLQVHGRMLSAIRTKGGAENVIVVDGAHCGQDVKTWTNTPVPERNSAILSQGPSLLRFEGRQWQNVLFSIHMYDQWGYDGLQMDTKLDDFIVRVHAKGMALMIGEVGATGPDDTHRAQAAGTAFRTAWQRHKVGMLAWHFDPKDAFQLVAKPGRSGADLDSPTAPTNLSSWLGAFFWRAGHPAAP